MIKRIGMFFLGCWVLNVQALPIVFTDSQYETSAVALAGLEADANFESSPPNGLPMVTSATVVGPDYFASGNGVAADGLLTTLTEASSTGDVANAVATAGFFGSFSGGGRFGLRLAFDTEDFTDAGAFSMGNLFLLLRSNDLPVLDLVFAASGLHDLAVFIPSGFSTLELLLSSEASLISGGNASNFASLNFELSSLVAEPPTWLLMLLGLLILLAWSGHRRPRGIARTA